MEKTQRKIQELKMHKSRQDLHGRFKLNSLRNKLYRPKSCPINICILFLQTLITPLKTMTPTMKTLLLLLTVLAVSSLLLSPAAAGNAKGPPTKLPLKDICNYIKINHPELEEFCMSTLKSAADSEKIDISAPLDLATALRLSIDTNIAYANTAIEHVNKLLADPKLERGTRVCLEHCNESFTSSVERLGNIKERIKAITYDWEKDIECGADIETWTSGLKFTECQVVFDEFSIKSVVPEIQEKLNKLWVLNTVIADIIYHFYVPLNNLSSVFYLRIITFLYTALLLFMTWSNLVLLFLTFLLVLACALTEAN